MTFFFVFIGGIALILWIISADGLARAAEGSTDRASASRVTLKSLIRFSGCSGARVLRFRFMGSMVRGSWVVHTVHVVLNP